MQLLLDILNRQFGGVLKRGKHSAPSKDADGEWSKYNGCCILELMSCAKGRRFDDHPGDLKIIDLRGMNDQDVWSDEQRTRYMLPLACELDGSGTWPTEKMQLFLTKVVFRFHDRVHEQSLTAQQTVGFRHFVNKALRKLSTGDAQWGVIWDCLVSFLYYYTLEVERQQYLINIAVDMLDCAKQVNA